MKIDILNTLLRSKQTIFTFKEIVLFSEGKIDVGLLRRRMSYYIKKGDLIALRRGIYAKDTKYDKFELANRIYTPSYISFETVLHRAGVIFKFHSPIFLASYLTREINIDGQTYSFKTIKNQILTGFLPLRGIEHKGSYSIATPERAFLDIVYLYKEYHFDNLSALDWEKVFEILPIYTNKEMEVRVKKYYSLFQTSE